MTGPDEGYDNDGIDKDAVAVAVAKLVGTIVFTETSVTGLGTVASEVQSRVSTALTAARGTCTTICTRTEVEAEKGCCCP